MWLDKYKSFQKDLLEKYNSVRNEFFDKEVYLTIGSTKKCALSPIFTPVRTTSRSVVFGVVIFETRYIDLICQVLDGAVDCIFIDIEKKVPLRLMPHDSNGNQLIDTANISKRAKEIFTKTEIFDYMPNDLTVNSVWSYLSSNGIFSERKKYSVIGLGNIGSKLALKIVECGGWVVCSGRDHQEGRSIVEALNLIKHDWTLESISYEPSSLKAIFCADIVLLCSPGIHVLTEEMFPFIKKGATIIDVGKNNFDYNLVSSMNRPDLVFYRADVGHDLLSFIESEVNYKKYFIKKIGSIKKNGINFVSGGLIGPIGSYVVDSVYQPTALFGVVAVSGELSRPTEEQQRIFDQTFSEADGIE